MLVKLCDKPVLAGGEPKSFRVKGIEVFAIMVDDSFFCLDARCTHAGAPLAEGELNGKVLTCPWHYSQFNIANGIVLRGPAQKNLKTYRVEERQNSLFIDL